MKDHAGAGVAMLDGDGSPANCGGSLRLTPRIVEFERCSFGAKKALAEIELDGVGRFSIDYFEPGGSREPFIAARSICSRYTGAFERTFKLCDELAAAVLDVVLRRLEGEDSS